MRESNTSRFYRAAIVTGATLAMLAVVMGAFAAHGLKQMLDPHDLAIFETAARYQMYHAIALLIVGILASMPQFSTRWLKLRLAASGGWVQLPRWAALPSFSAGCS
jgi:uncharacterized membrane protein YgdD (TMEM256/DUF423 family)